MHPVYMYHLNIYVGSNLNLIEICAKQAYFENEYLPEVPLSPPVNDRCYHGYQ